MKRAIGFFLAVFLGGIFLAPPMLVRQGDRYREECHTLRALYCYAAALAIDRGNARAHRGRAEIWFNAEIWDRAYAEASAVVRVDPGDREALIWRAVAGTRTPQVPDPLPDLIRAWRHVGTRGQGWYIQRVLPRLARARAEERFRRRERDAGLSDLVLADEVEADVMPPGGHRARALLQRADIRRAAGDRDGAREDLFAAYRATPSEFAYLTQVATRAVDDRYFDTLVGEAKALSAVQPGPQEAALLVCLLATRARRWAQWPPRPRAAVADWTAVLDLRPGDLDALFGRGLARFDLGD